MEAVSSATSAVVQPPQTQVRSERAERPEPPPKPQTAPTPPEQRTQQQAEAQAPRPVTNLQGQRTGTIINTSA